MRTPGYLEFYSLFYRIYLLTRGNFSTSHPLISLSCLSKVQVHEPLNSTKISHKSTWIRLSTVELMWVRVVGLVPKKVGKIYEKPALFES